MELHDVTNATYLDGHRLEVTFDDGITGIVDVSEYVRPLEGVFEPLRDESEVAKAFVDGGAVCWPNGADLAPEVLYDHIKAQSVSAA